ncbi:MAG: hypothetical protein COV55_01950 [Candidatus Komeilibacteria bacterium CG11_big_fil_rev_8_21_14_0_20_36_20]|uniref:Uncharacterized protein n=1 Tax=Candidatus Komeilibacteria bacterium CG11_big_fil_rev_8_21_14_0_20_36_20 TaxID=1974477 RepID=A0A2H0NFJ1_9BACT|nr:MAG: hypothetical protein COV55_01950 [Candidatus Komeilibacteria bacterium CG11_big_fil_rev_8_21_14_0_20_36_20]PIR81560.1 MAG: hypothetical protein COU21_02760 [Candidatus Komeilibacteria bacterium CG10_big_fil_rev_8_21_14_0_10_36_65]PJC55398.1 MAG: hypothetical protein CO027_02060 [Candidatus Komeilibacteria bacterium CG_4_9_14_0_2_um_filter_36_13]
MNKINKRHLSISTVVIFVLSVFSLIFFRQNVLAIWQDPTGYPVETNLDNIVFNPLGENLDLNDHWIFDSSNPAFGLDPNPASQYGLVIGGTDYAGYFNGRVNASVNPGDDALCINENCIASWSDVSGDTFWEAGSGTDIYYNPLTKNGYVGIGTFNPNRKLHIYDTNVNAEIDIQSTVADYWAIYHDKDSNDLRFWQDDNIITFTSQGQVGIGKTNPNSGTMLHVFTNEANKTAILGQNLVEDNYAVGVYGGVFGNKDSIGIYGNAARGGKGVYGISAEYPGVGVYGEGNLFGVHGYSTLEGNVGVGVFGEGANGVYGRSTGGGGSGVYGQQGDGAYAGYFEGDVRVQGSIFGLGVSIVENDGIKDVEARKILDASYMDEYNEVIFPQFDEAINALTLYANRNDIDSYGNDTGEMYWSARGDDPNSKYAASLRNIFPTSITAVYTENNGDDWKEVRNFNIVYNHCDNNTVRDRIEIEGLTLADEVYATVFYRVWPDTGWPCGQGPNPPEYEGS